MSKPGCQLCKSCRIKLRTTLGHSTKLPCQMATLHDLSSSKATGRITTDNAGPDAVGSIAEAVVVVEAAAAEEVEEEEEAAAVAEVVVADTQIARRGKCGRLESLEEVYSPKQQEDCMLWPASPLTLPSPRSWGPSHV